MEDEPMGILYLMNVKNSIFNLRGTIWEVPKTRGILLGVPIIRTIAY